VIAPLLLEDLSEIARPKGIHVDFDLNTPGVRIMIKIAQFKNILRLLINNAAKAMSQTDEKKILVSTRLINNNAAVEILFQDFGPGISEEKHPLAFHRPFTTKETGGYGLLFIRQMIEDMHGEITLLPYQQEKGAGFLIHLPVSTLDQGVQHAY
jgi:two-component system sporulation sensor kinase A